MDSGIRQTWEPEETCKFLAILLMAYDSEQPTLVCYANALAIVWVSVTTHI